MTDPTTEYANKVVNGEIIAGIWVRLACERHLRDLKKYHNKKSYWFDETEADRIFRFFETYLIFYEGDFDSKPFKLELWQKFILGSLFGWKNGNFRRFRTAYVEIGKGNGKSPMAAGIGLYGMLSDGEPGAEIYAAATTREQAGILFRDAKAFAEGHEKLRKRLNINQNSVNFDEKNSYFRPVSSEHRGLDGKRPHIALIDEIHEHPNGIVVDKMRAGTKGRRQAMIFEITNSGYDRNTICYQHHDYSEKILQGVFDNEQWFSYMAGLDVCEACREKGATIPQEGCPDCDDWTNPLVWIKANPNLGVSIRNDYLEEQVKEALGLPSKQNIVKRLNFCIWTEGETKWMSLDKWIACKGEYDEKFLAGRECYAGLDLSTTTDLTALVLVFPPKDGLDKYHVLSRFWVPKDSMPERIRRDRVPYDVWTRDNHLYGTNGNVVDYSFILAKIAEDMEKFDLREIAFDRWGSTKIIADLQEMGFEETKNKHAWRYLVDFGQGFASMSAPTKEVEKLVLSNEILHDGNPVLTWCMSNTVVKIDPSGNIKPDKEKSTERIDGTVALIMAVSRAVAHCYDSSVYDNSGIKMLEI